MRFTIFTLIQISLASFAIAQDALLYKEINLIIGYKAGITGKSNSQMNSVGFEYLKKLSMQERDLFTLNLQTRVSYDTEKPPQEAFAIELHNAWIEYNLSLGNKLRIGHIEPSSGLEPMLDTHSTLLQTLSCKSIGFKKDWGIKFKNLQEQYELETSLTTGSGMSIRRKYDSFLFATRIATGDDEDFNIGLSLLYGKVLKSKGMSTYPPSKLVSNKATTKKRISLDWQYSIFPFTIKAEVCSGEDDDNALIGGFLQIDCIPYLINEELKISAQGIYWQKEVSFNIGVSYNISPAVTLRCAYFEEDRAMFVQFYYYGR